MSSSPACERLRMNAVMERWIQTCRRELLDRTLIWNQRQLVHAPHQYERHDNALPLRPIPPPITDPDRSQARRARYQSRFIRTCRVDGHDANGLAVRVTCCCLWLMWATSALACPCPSPCSVLSQLTSSFAILRHRGYRLALSSEACRPLIRDEVGR